MKIPVVNFLPDIEDEVSFLSAQESLYSNLLIRIYVYICFLVWGVGVYLTKLASG